MKLTIDKLNELHVTGKISDDVYNQYSTLLINSGDIECIISPDGRISLSIKMY
jgi:hypothetical protein